MPRISHPRPESASTLDANQVVAYNFARARRRRGWTQRETAQRLEPHLGHRLTNVSISTIERSAEGKRRRVFTAQELVAYALTFDVSLLWFFVPPAVPDHITLDGLDGPLAELWRLAVGTDRQTDDLVARLNELANTNPTAAQHCVDSAVGGRAANLQQQRRRMLQALIVEERQAVDDLFAELRRLVARYEALPGLAALFDPDSDGFEAAESLSALQEPV